LAFTTTSLVQKIKPRSPAVIALLIQLAAFLLIALVLTFAWRAFQFKLSLNQAIIWQAILALLITRMCNLAWWWSVIQPLFPFALVLMLLLRLPPYLYLILFLFFLVFYWSAYRTQVPYFPSTKHVWLAVEKQLPQDRAISFVDIGSGLGGLVLYLASRFPESRFTGVEIAPLPWLLSYLRTGGKANAEFLRNTYEAMNFSEFDVIFAYLSPAAMSALWIKAEKEMRPGSMLISYEFPINEADPDLSIFPENKQINGRKLFIWYL